MSAIASNYKRAGRLLTDVAILRFYFSVEIAAAVNPPRKRVVFTFPIRR